MQDFLSEVTVACTVGPEGQASMKEIEVVFVQFVVWSLLEGCLAWWEKKEESLVSFRLKRAG